MKIDYQKFILYQKMYKDEYFKKNEINIIRETFVNNNNFNLIIDKSYISLNTSQNETLYFLNKKEDNWILLHSAFKYGDHFFYRIDGFDNSIKFIKLIENNRKTIDNFDEFISFLKNLKI